jgi:type IV pilus assembly protein PilA
MIVIAVIAILLTLAVPTYSSYTIRAKIAEGLSLAMAAKTATTASCQEDITLTSLTNFRAGYLFTESPAETDYIEDIIISGDCSAPLITIHTKNTGALDPQPIISLTGEFPSSLLGQVRWNCASTNTPNHLLPGSCRS